MSVFLNLAYKLQDWAQNEEMVNQYYTEHGKDCLEAAKLLINQHNVLYYDNVNDEDSSS